MHLQKPPLPSKKAFTLMEYALLSAVIGTLAIGGMAAYRNNTAEANKSRAQTTLMQLRTSLATLYLDKVKTNPSAPAPTVNELMLATGATQVNSQNATVTPSITWSLTQGSCGGGSQTVTASSVAAIAQLSTTIPNCPGNVYTVSSVNETTGAFNIACNGSFPSICSYSLTATNITPATPTPTPTPTTVASSVNSKMYLASDGSGICAAKGQKILLEKTTGGNTTSGSDLVKDVSSLVEDQNCN